MITLQKIATARSVDELKKLGKYLEIKSLIETQLHIKLGARGWSSLSKRLNLLRSADPEHINPRLTRPFSSSKSSLSKTLNLKITAQNEYELQQTLAKLTKYFWCTTESIEHRFESKKFKNFINSSRLEGIIIQTPNKNISLESILAKHRR